MLKNKKFFLAVALSCLFCCSPFIVEAQTDSPYSRYGLGKLSNQATGPSKGMGGVGYGLHTGQSANPMNPASYAQVDSLTFIFDIGINFNKTSYKEGSVKASKSGGGLDYITLLFPVSKNFGVSLGLLPYSSTGYKLERIRTVPATGTGKDVSYVVGNSGKGGLSQAYLGLGYKLPVKGLSVGFNASYLFGKLEHTNAELVQVSEVADLMKKVTTLNVTSMKFDIGLQYRLDFKDYSSLTLGAVYTPKINGTGKLERYEYDNKTTLATRTVNESIATGTPHTFGFGFAYNHKQNWLVGADATYQNWKGAKFSDKLSDQLSSDKRFNNSWRFALGAEYRIAPYSKNYFEKVKFRGGFNYSNSYVNVNTAENVAKGYNEYGATVGFGFPVTDREDLGGRISYINVNFEYKYLKPGFSSMVKENYFGVSLNMNINELWFLQRKIN